MRARSRARWLALGIVVALAAPAARADETPIPPPPTRWVTDHAGFMSPAAARALDDRLAEYDQRTGHQVLVYIDRTTGGVPIEDWAVRAFERWRVGRKGIDDGVAMFVFSDDRRVRIEVGYGLEDRVPDAIASRIISDRMVPRIRAGDRDGAVTTGVDALLAAVGGEGRAAERPAVPIAGWKLVAGGLFLLVLLLLAITHPGLAWLLLMNVGSGRRRGGGWGGGFGGRGGFGGGGFSGGGGRSGGGGASGSW